MDLPYKFLLMLPCLSLSVLVPTMHIHLLALRSNNSLTRRLGLHKLHFYMTIMAELADIYWSGDLIYKIFKEAVSRLVKDDDQGSSRQSSRQPPSSEDDVCTDPSDELPPLNMNIHNVLETYDILREEFNGFVATFNLCPNEI